MDISLLGYLAYVFFGISFWQFLCWWEYKTETKDPKYWEHLMRWRFWGLSIATLVFVALACLFN